MLSIELRKLAANAIAKKTGTKYSSALRRINRNLSGETNVSSNTINILTSLTKKRGGETAKKLREVKNVLSELPKEFFQRSEEFQSGMQIILWHDKRFFNRKEAIEFALDCWNEGGYEHDTMLERTGDEGSNLNITITDVSAGNVEVLNHIYSKKDKSTHSVYYKRNYHLVYNIQFPISESNKGRR